MRARGGSEKSEPPQVDEVPSLGFDAISQSRGSRDSPGVSGVLPVDALRDAFRFESLSVVLGPML